MPAEQSYGDNPKEATASQRTEARQALQDVLTKGSDDEFDQLGAVLALGIEIEAMFKGIDAAMELAEKLGARTAKAVAAVSHFGHEYHVAVERCPHCEQAKAEGGE